MKQILIGKAVNYAASKTSATAESATNPDLLAEGAIGIYGIDNTAGNDNAGKLVLITLATNAAGKVADSDYKGDMIYLAQGTREGSFLSNGIQVGGIKSIVGKVYAAAVLQVSYVGFNGTSGSLNLDQFLDRDEGTIGITSTTLDSQQFPKDNYSTNRIYANSDVYDVLVSVLAKNRADQQRIVSVGLVSNGTATNFTAVAGVVNDSPIVTSATHGRAVGDLVKLDGEVYKVVAVPSAGVFEIDRPFHGATASLAVTAAQSLADVTEYGFKITALEAGEYFEPSADGIFQRANLSTPVPAQPGTGAGPQVVALEKNRQAYAGFHDKIDARVKSPYTFADPTLNYNLYNIVASNGVKNRAMMGYMNAVDLNVMAAFVNGGAGTNQSSTAAILTQLFPAMVNIA